MIIYKPYTSKQYADLASYCNANNCHIEDKGAYLESVANAKHVPTNEEVIAKLKQELASYDYIGVKIAMGVATKEDYAEKIAYTEEIRQQIRALEQ